MKTSFSRLALWALLLIVFEILNVGVFVWLFGTVGGLLIGLMFGFGGATGVFITPNSPGWLNPTWSVLSLVANGAIVGTAVKNAAFVFALGDPIVAMVVAAIVFAIAHAFLVYKVRMAIAGYWH